MGLFGGFEGAAFFDGVLDAAGDAAVTADGEEAETLGEAFFDFRATTEGAEWDIGFFGGGDNLFDGGLDGWIFEGHAQREGKV